MIAKAKAISHGKEAINYALREGKMGIFLCSNLIASNNPAEILQEFEMTQRYNERCKNKFLRFEIGIAPQDESKLTKQDLRIICRKFTKAMGLQDNQWFACTHKDTDNLHIHLIANRLSIGGAVHQTDFVSNRASKIAEDISRKMGLTIANEVRRQKQHDKQQMSPTRFEIKKRLQDIAYREFRNIANKTPKNFIDALKKQGVIVEPVRNKQNKIYGIRFQYEEQTLKASEIGKEFGLRSLFHHYGYSIDERRIQPKHFEKPHLDNTQTGSGLLSGLASIIIPEASSGEYE
ncbi:hypothetical protein FACS189432_09420 [Bacteroidia bacterium]|nr:hypothetical protein FACS189426_20420 [Bacteroidia bacterium]GHT30159.1 hypothetical protein FACS189432_09420 [Bacteroidia bacterium]